MFEAACVRFQWEIDVALQQGRDGNMDDTNGTIATLFDDFCLHEIYFSGDALNQESSLVEFGDDLRVTIRAKLTKMVEKAVKAGLSNKGR